MRIKDVAQAVRMICKAKQKWKETQDKRLKHTKTSLKPAVYAGTYRSDVIGDILIKKSGENMTLKTTRVDFEMTHWHLDTFLVEFRDWELHEFVAFNIGPDGKISSLKIFGDTFNRVEEQKTQERKSE